MRRWVGTIALAGILGLGAPIAAAPPAAAQGMVEYGITCEGLVQVALAKHLITPAQAAHLVDECREVLSRPAVIAFINWLLSRQPH